MTTKSLRSTRLEQYPMSNGRITVCWFTHRSCRFGFWSTKSRFWTTKRRSVGDGSEDSWWYFDFLVFCLLRFWGSRSSNHLKMFFKLRCIWRNVVIFIIHFWLIIIFPYLFYNLVKFVKGIHNADTYISHEIEILHTFYSTLFLWYNIQNLSLFLYIYYDMTYTHNTIERS